MGSDYQRRRRFNKKASAPSGQPLGNHPMGMNTIILAAAQQMNQGKQLGQHKKRYKSVPHWFLFQVRQYSAAIWKTFPARDKVTVAGYLNSVQVFFDCSSGCMRSQNVYKESITQTAAQLIHERWFDIIFPAWKSWSEHKDFFPGCMFLQIFITFSLMFSLVPQCVVAIGSVHCFAADI